MGWITIETPYLFMKDRLIYSILAVVLSLIGDPLFMDNRAHAAENEWISFASDRSGNFEIYSMKTNNGDLRRIPTNLGHEDRRPWFPNLAWAPDGSFLAHTASRDGLKIYVMNTKTREHRRLTDLHREEWSPAISPDGKQIAYVARDHEMNRIYKTDINGADVIALTALGYHGRPAWSPDGKQIAFISSNHDRDKKGGLYVMNNDGKNLRQVPVFAAGTFHNKCAWSPDGKQIAFSISTPQAQRDHLCVIDVSGKNFRQLTQGGPLKEAGNFPLPLPLSLPMIDSPAWSPDGKWIAYVYSDTIFWQTADIYVIDAAGNELGKPLVQGVGMDVSPAWVPEGFLSVSLNAEKQITLWIRLKQTAD